MATVRHSCPRRCGSAITPDCDRTAKLRFHCAFTRITIITDTDADATTVMSNGVTGRAMHNYRFQCIMTDLCDAADDALGTASSVCRA